MRKQSKEKINKYSRGDTPSFLNYTKRGTSPKARELLMKESKDAKK